MSLSAEGQHLFDYFKTVGVSYHEDVVNVYREISEGLGRGDRSRELDRTITSINVVIKEYGLEILDGTDDLSSRKMYCLVSTRNNAVPEKASVYDKATRQLLSKIVEDCIVSGNGYTTEISCLNYVDLDARKSNIQSSIERLVQDKWIASENGKITLGARSHMELEMHIKNHYSDYVKYCSLCKTFLLQGFTCSRCVCHMHFHCLKKLCQRHNLSDASDMCPKCRNGRNGCKASTSSQSDINSSALTEMYDSDTDESSKSSADSDETAIVNDAPIQKRLRRS